MIAVHAGDAATYEKLLLELPPIIRRQVAGRVALPAEREDIVQNVLISLHRARHTYRSEHPFLPWLRAIVRNASIDWMRARGRRSRAAPGSAFPNGGFSRRSRPSTSRPRSSLGAGRSRRRRYRSSYAACSNAA